MIFVVSGIVTGCVGTIAAPVTDRTSKPVKLSYHKVREGDTLYSIAWIAGVDYRALARWNGIGSPYVIRPGQRVSLVPVKTTSRPKTATPSISATAKTKDVPKTNLKVIWGWPSEGSLARRFSSARGSKGIDISGVSGRRVRTAAKGRVVYAGSGLRGYGKLIIVKHNDIYLSAYAHNRELLVKEGDTVRAGQQIAEMGNTGTDKVKLHFQIRKLGVPVNPLRYLPKRL